MKDKIVQKYDQDLNRLGIKHDFIEHPSLVEVRDVMEFLNLPLSLSSAILVMKADGNYIAIIRRGDTELDLKKTKQILSVKNLQIASKDEFSKITGFKPGAAHYLTGFKTYIDKKVFENEFVYGGSGSLLITTKYRSKDLLKIPNSEVVDIAQIKAKPRILTGDTPTGKLHLGHYVGALENRIKLQHEYDTYIILANVHAYASNYQNPDIINESVYNVFLDNLAVGLDPNVATIFLESGVPEIYEFYAQFLTMVKHSRIIRNPTIKEEIKYKKLDPSVGFIMYPILQAADILAFNADLVPVGEDQLPVLEQTREIAREFNKTYGDTFVVPEAKMGRVARLVGTDGTMKMSKSGGNAILLSEDKETLKKKVMSIYTDPNRIHSTDPGKVEGNPVFIYHDVFNQKKEEVIDLKERYLSGKVGDIEVKEKLFIALDNFLTPIREKRKYYEDRPKEAKEILMEGTKRARKTAQEVLEKFREKTKFLDLIK